jgi:hypothetical protein
MVRPGSTRITDRFDQESIGTGLIFRNFLQPFGESFRFAFILAAEGKVFFQNAGWTSIPAFFLASADHSQG